MLGSLQVTFEQDTKLGEDKTRRLMAQVIDEMVVITWDDSLGRARAYEPKQGVALANRWNLEVEPEAGADNVGTIKSFEHRFNRHGISKINARTDADTEFP